ncbi:hypothetical protein [Winogradskyella jejuensis]|uniref:Entericidin EcnA/B family protein n=1 Tax=Winogradskyella jejuensis TaxID=1089305 RepID=A0A1M5UXG0_9FLAO|nr:hypothetical protein [Winogradskyella jejuensis]SHH67620.1 hypothetical protein SAMN05444148_2637 [Winogradskyella jejuensis]
MKLKTITFALLTLLSISLFNCREQTTAEKAGEALEEGVEEVTDEIDDATK